MVVRLKFTRASQQLIVIVSVSLAVEGEKSYGIGNLDIG